MESLPSDNPSSPTVMKTWCFIQFIYVQKCTVFQPRCQTPFSRQVKGTFPLYKPTAIVLWIVIRQRPCTSRCILGICIWPLERCYMYLSSQYLHCFVCSVWVSQKWESCKHDWYFVANYTKQDEACEKDPSCKGWQ